MATNLVHHPTGSESRLTLRNSWFASESASAPATGLVLAGQHQRPLARQCGCAGVDLAVLTCDRLLEAEFPSRVVHSARDAHAICLDFACDRTIALFQGHCVLLCTGKHQTTRSQACQSQPRNHSGSVE